MDPEVLIDATTSASVETVEARLREGAAPNALGRDGLRALHVALVQCDVPMVAAMLAHGGDPRVGTGRDHLYWYGNRQPQLATSIPRGSDAWEIVAIALAKTRWDRYRELRALLGPRPAKDEVPEPRFEPASIALASVTPEVILWNAAEFLVAARVPDGVVRFHGPRHAEAPSEVARMNSDDADAWLEQTRKRGILDGMSTTENSIVPTFLHTPAAAIPMRTPPDVAPPEGIACFDAIDRDVWTRMFVPRPVLAFPMRGKFDLASLLKTLRTWEIAGAEHQLVPLEPLAAVAGAKVERDVLLIVPWGHDALATYERRTAVFDLCLPAMPKRWKLVPNGAPRLGIVVQPGWADRAEVTAERTLVDDSSVLDEGEIVRTDGGTRVAVRVLGTLEIGDRATFLDVTEVLLATGIERPRVVAWFSDGTGQYSGGGPCLPA